MRAKRKITQAEFAKKFQLSRSTYESYENGRRNPDIETLIRIANFFEIPFFYLLDSYGLEKEMWKQILIIKDDV